MSTIWDQIRDLQKVPNKSKVKFSWNFHEEMEKLLKKVEKAVKTEIVPNYQVEYVNYWTASMRIKINDKNKWIEKLITCNFTYNNVDERYWYIDPELLSSELSQKTKVYSMWKFPIIEHERIVVDFVKKLIIVIESY